MAGPYTDIQAIEMQLRTVTNRIRITDVAPAPGTNSSDIDIADVQQQRVSSEASIETRLERFYSVPLSLTETRTIALIKTIATKLTAYNVWTALHPAMTISDLPAAVKEWKADVEATLESIVPKGRDAPVQGRDVILAGEALTVGGGDPTKADIYFTTKLPFGGTA